MVISCKDKIFWLILRDELIPKTLMKKITLLITALVLSISASAKTTKEEIFENVRLSASQYLAYPGVSDTVKYTPAPKGYKPFYISTYARHGSRFLISEKDYKGPQKVLAMADSMNLLTEDGKKVKAIVDSVCIIAKDRYEELTTIGFAQHKGIAERMVANFPEIFKGKKHIDARSTPVPRCMLSMMSECYAIKTLNPDLTIFTDASKSDMYYLNCWWSPMHKCGDQKKIDKVKQALKDSLRTPDRLISTLFKDYTPLESTLSKRAMYKDLFELAASMQNIDTELDLYPFFTKQECYDNWQIQNFSWYVNNGPSPVSESCRPYAHEGLLRHIISTADSIMATGDNTCATLRFGHDGILLPLASLLRLDNCNYQSTDFTDIANNWRCHEISPMAGNIQIIFFKSGKKEAPVLVKFMLNEHECHIPLQAINGVYYRWDEVKQFYLNDVLK